MAESQKAAAEAEARQRQLQTAEGRVTDLLKAQDRAKRAAELKANEFSAKQSSMTADLDELQVGASSLLGGCIGRMLDLLGQEKSCDLLCLRDNLMRTAAAAKQAVLGSSLGCLHSLDHLQAAL